MELKLALEGNLMEHLRQEISLIDRGLQRALEGVTTGMKEELRSQVRRARLGKLEKTWQSKIYKQDKASIVFSKAQKIMQGFATGVTIRSKYGRFLAIPTDAAPKRGMGGKRINPFNFPEHRYGPLRFIYRATGPSLLVVENQRRRTGKRGGYSRAGEKAIQAGNVATVVMFILVPRVRIQRRLDIEAVKARWAAKLPEIIVKSIEREERG